MATLTLAGLPLGSRASIVAIRGERSLNVRLLEMGLVRGTVVELVRRAPLGDPLELRVRGYSLSIRDAEASLIEIEPVGAVDTEPNAQPVPRAAAAGRAA
jgi:ferrous iron transport protein A